MTQSPLAHKPNIGDAENLALAPYRVRPWALGALAVLGLHGAALAIALTWRPAMVAHPPEIEAVMIEIAPAPPMPAPPTPAPLPPEIKPQPKPELPKPIPKPKPIPAKMPKVVDPTPKPMAEPEQSPPQLQASSPISQSQTPRPLSGLPSWKGQVRAHLERNKQYPRIAQSRRQEGICVIAFVIDRQGRILSSHIKTSSGHSALDAETENLLRRAQPLPIPPDDVPGDKIELIFPIQYQLIR